MVLKLYNTLSRKKEVFQPIEPGKVMIYTCGPTVYDFAHVGNLRTYVFQDVLIRWLEYKGYQVYHVMNVTDVDDKMIRRSLIEKVSLKTLADTYTKAFLEDMKLLNIRKADRYPKATEHIPDMVDFIKQLIDKGYAYKSENGSIYFDVSKSQDYGKLSGTTRIENYPDTLVSNEKEDPRDFALWKAWDENDGEVFWDTELGRGRPGWHIECSTMSMKTLGKTFDIHSGGVDLIFPHHENEIAQSEAISGNIFVNYWLHVAHLMVEGQKMAKSLGNFYTLKNLSEQGYKPLTIRYRLLLTHYRKQLNFTLKGLKAAQDSLEKLSNFITRLSETTGASDCPQVPGLMERVRIGFQEAMDDDLNTNQALYSIFWFVRKINRLIDEEKISQHDGEAIHRLMLDFDRVLAVFSPLIGSRRLQSQIRELIQTREEARKNKDWKTADRMRAEIESMGVRLEDTPNGVKWKFL